MDMGEDGHLRCHSSCRVKYPKPTARLHTPKSYLAVLPFLTVSAFVYRSQVLAVEACRGGSVGGFLSYGVTFGCVPADLVTKMSRNVRHDAPV